MRSSFSPCGTPVSTSFYPPPPHYRIHRESSLSTRWKRIKSGIYPRRIIEPLTNLFLRHRHFGGGSGGVDRVSPPHLSEDEDKRGSGLPLQLIRNDGRYHHIPQPTYLNGRAHEDEIRPYDEEEDDEDSPPYQLADPGRKQPSQQIYQQHTDSEISELKN